MSLEQEGLWLACELEPESPCYNSGIALRWRGPLCIEWLSWSLNRIVERHESLRTIFQNLDGELMQLVQPFSPFRFESIDLCELELHRAEQIVLEIARAYIGARFCVEASLPWRSAVVRLAETNYVVVVAAHHIVADDPAFSIFLDELAGWYTKRECFQAPRIAVQPGDYAAWQRNGATSSRRTMDREYWSRQLEGAPPGNLPIEVGRMAGELSARGTSIPIRVSVSTWERVRRMCGKHRVTPFVFLLAVFKLLLFRYTGNDDVVVGAPITRRTRLELEPVIGYFVNMVVLRTRISAEWSFESLLQAVSRTVREAYDHSGLPFREVVKELRPQSAAHRSPLFRAVFTVQGHGESSVLVPGVDIETVHMNPGTSAFDLIVTFSSRKGSLSGWLRYRTDVFEATLIHRMSEHLTNLLEGVCATPGTVIDDLELLSEAEQQQLQDWGGR